MQKNLVVIISTGFEPPRHSALPLHRKLLTSQPTDHFYKSKPKKSSKVGVSIFLNNADTEKTRPK
jgi:hypothetical protein